MEANRLRRGLKAKLSMSFYRAPKPSLMPYSSTVKPAASASMASLGFVVEDKGFIQPAPNQKAPTPKKEGGGERRNSQRSSYGYGGSLTNDPDSVDKRAATYISYVQERFKLEQMESNKNQ